MSDSSVVKQFGVFKAKFDCLGTVRNGLLVVTEPFMGSSAAIERRASLGLSSMAMVLCEINCCG